MAEEKKSEQSCCHYKGKKHWHSGKGGGAGALYFMGFIGAAVYFIGQATTFGMGVLGFLKALVWPAFLVYELLKFLLG